MYGNDPQQIAEAELDSGERLLWSGRPDPRQAVRFRWPTVFFGLFFGGFAGFWIAGAYTLLTSGHAPGPFLFLPLFGLPFLLVVLGVMWKTYFAVERVTNTVYAVTDRRLLIIVGGRNKTVQSYGPQEIGNLERVEQPDGSGTLTFALQFNSYTARNSVAYPSTSRYSQFKNVQFIGIPDVRAVENLIRETFLRAPSP